MMLVQMFKDVDAVPFSKSANGESKEVQTLKEARQVAIRFLRKNRGGKAIIHGYRSTTKFTVKGDIVTVIDRNGVKRWDVTKLSKPWW